MGNESGGIGFVGLLTIVFIILKLVGTISWSWWWILSPLWISFSLGMLIILFTGCVFLIIHIWEKKIEKKEVKLSR